MNKRSSIQEKRLLYFCLSKFQNTQTHKMKILIPAIKKILTSAFSETSFLYGTYFITVCLINHHCEKSFAPAVQFRDNFIFGWKKAWFEFAFRSDNDGHYSSWRQNRYLPILINWWLSFRHIRAVRPKSVCKLLPHKTCIHIEICPEHRKML